jgi:phospholipase C
MDRRDFLRTTGIVGAAAALGPTVLSGCVPASRGTGLEYVPTSVPEGSLLASPASEAPIDHVVILMMENRSFDHFLGWLGADEGYLERGRQRYGADFSIDARPHQTYLDTEGRPVDTFSMGGGTSPVGFRGCDFTDPGHSWTSGRAERDGGFLSAGTGNDALALGYQEGADLPFHARMARRFTTFDRYHASLLASTQPNRRYLHSAQSGGYKNNYIPLKEGGHQWATIWDRLRAARVPVRSYSPDLPSLAFWGPRMAPILSPIDDYFHACSAGRLPAVTFLDPPYLPWWQADDHPLCDPAAGQRYLRDVFRAFTRSPHWERGLFILTYDEWGGFFDHVAPPVLPDLLASPVDDENFGQAGFRVPTIMASPYARPGFVDHRLYDHTSIMRFLEWRFLGAPPEGSSGAGWWLTPRDRAANNIGASLGATNPDPELFDLDDLPLRAPTPRCDGSAQVIAPGMQVGGPGADLLDALESGYFDKVGVSSDPSSLAGTWAAGGDVA